MSSKRFVLQTLCLTLVLLLVLAGITVYVDPLFHYHAPQEDIAYLISNQRYQNDGILKHFSYDAIITGTSMTENFKTSEFDELFGTQSIKVPFSGSYLRETAERLNQAFAHCSDIKYVVRSLDYYALVADKDAISDFSYPEYLYDDIWLNDVQYLLNKTIFCDYTLETLNRTSRGDVMTSFDNYARWSDWFFYGKQEVLSKTTRPMKSDQVAVLTNSQILQIKENLEQNIISLAREHPETEFFLFFPPYSIVCWDHWNQQGNIQARIDAYQYAAEILMDYDNIHLFSFNTYFDMICDLDNYKDLEHYGDWVNSKILFWMKNGEYELTEQNYQEHFEEMRAFHSSYDYDSLYG